MTLPVPGTVRCLIIAVGAFGASFIPATDATSQLVDSPGKILERLDLDTSTVGRVTAHFRQPDRPRALELAALVEQAAAMFEDKLRLSFPIELAALTPDDWFSDIPGIPYAIPWPSMNERLLLLPSSLRVGLMVEGREPVVAKRLVDFVALHEYGHIAAKEYFRPGDRADYIPVQWFRELIATYFAYSYIATGDPAWARASRAEWETAVAASAPPVLSLDWGFMNEMTGIELAQTYEWYQLMLNLKAAELFDVHGVALLPALKRLPWNQSRDWTSAVVVESLQSIDAGLADWARNFGVPRSDGDRGMGDTRQDHHDISLEMER